MTECFPENMTAAEEILRFSYGGEDGNLYVFINGRNQQGSIWIMCTSKSNNIYDLDVIEMEKFYNTWGKISVSVLIILNGSFLAGAGHPGCK